MNPAAAAISLNVLSSFLYDLLRRARGSSASLVDQAAARTAESFPDIEGLKTTLGEWLISPDVAKTLDEYTNGIAGQGDINIDVLTNVLIEKTRFFLPDRGDRARQIIARLLSEIRIQYLRTPERALPIIGNRLEEGLRQTAAGFESVLASLEDAKSRGALAPAAGDQSGLDAQIDEAKDHLDRYNYELARHACQGLRRRHWDQLSPRQRFRILSVLGAVNLAEGHFTEAAQAFIEAKEFQPDDPVALGNEARAYRLLDHAEHAFELAARAKDRFPSSSLVLTVWLDVAPPSTPFEELAAAVPPHLGGDADVLTILARRALMLRENARAEALARSATLAKPQWSYPWAVLGETIFRSALPEASVDYARMSTVASEARLQEADEACSKAIELAKTEKQAEIQAGTLLVRAEVRRGLGDESAADEDVIAAFSLDRAEPTVIREYARLKLRRGEPEDSVRLLRSALERDSRRDLRMLLAIALSEQETPGKRAEARPIYESLWSDPDETETSFKTHALEAALADLVKDQSWEDGRSMLARLPKGAVSAAALAAFQARLEFAAGNLEKAAELASNSRDALAENASRDDLRLVATLLSELGRYGDAFPLWQRLVSAPDLGFDTSRLIDCALRLGEHETLLRTCEQLRAKGLYDKQLVHIEARIREPYDVEAAIALLQDYLTRFPDDRAVRLQLSDIGLRQDRSELVVSDPAGMPSADDVPHENWKLMVHVMKRGGHLEQALRFAYTLLRGNFEDPEAHRAYRAALMPTGPCPNLPVTVEAVASGCAVAFIEDRTSLEEWRVIEDEYEPKADLHEIGPDHFIAREALGKRVGQSFLLARGSVTSRTAKITQILNKYVYRYQDCMTNWQKRFPELPDIQAMRMEVHLDPTGQLQPDLTDFFASFDRIVAQHDSIMEAYRSQPLPLHLLAGASGHCDFDEYIRIALDGATNVRCCRGSAPEHIAAMVALRNATAVVLDLSAIATLALLDALDSLAVFPCSILVSELTLAELKRSGEEPSCGRGEMGSLGKQAGRYVFEKQTSESLEQHRTLVQTIVDKVQAHCAVVACAELASVPPNKREPLIKLIGMHSAQSVLLATVPGRVLWTDDFVVSMLAATEFQVNRIWTRAAFELQARSGRIEQEMLSDITAKLIGWRYYFTTPNPSSLVRAASLARWNPGSWPLRQAIDQISDETISMRDTLVLTIAFVVKYANEVALPEDRDALTVALLESLAKRAGGLAGICELLDAIPSAFGLNVIRATETAETVRAWLASRGLRPPN